MTWGRKTGGRKAGTPNKKTSEIIEKAKAAGELPLEYMLRRMNDPKADQRERDDMAKSAAPYVHPRLTADPTHTQVNVAAGSMSNGQLNAEVVGIRVEFVRPRPQLDGDG